MWIEVEFEVTKKETVVWCIFCLGGAWSNILGDIQDNMQINDFLTE